MVKVVFRKDNGDEKVVNYTKQEVDTYGREAVVRISDQTLELSNEFTSYRILEAEE